MTSLSLVSDILKPYFLLHLCHEIISTREDPWQLKRVQDLHFSVAIQSMTNWVNLWTSEMNCYLIYHPSPIIFTWVYSIPVPRDLCCNYSFFEFSVRLCIQKKGISLLCFFFMWNICQCLGIIFHKQTIIAGQKGATMEFRLGCSILISPFLQTSSS